MKFFAVCLALCLLGVHYVLAAGVTVGLYAPDRYDGIPDMCLMPMDFGYCRAKVKRYYFDMRRMKCNMFYFGGCAGNVNNFKSLDECNKVCLDGFEPEQQEVVAPNKERQIPYSSRSGNSGSSNTNSNSNSNNNDKTNTNSNENKKFTPSNNFKLFKIKNNSNDNNNSDNINKDNDNYDTSYERRY